RRRRPSVMRDARGPVPRSWAVGGVVGPAIFVSAWVVLGTRRSGYSPMNDPISRLAAVGMSTRVAMTLGIVALAVGLVAYAHALHGRVPGAIAPVAALSAAATLVVAIFPLGSALGDRPHAAAAAAAYATLAAL